MAAVEEATTKPPPPTPPPTTTELREYKDKLSKLCQQQEHEARLQQKLKQLPPKSKIGIGGDKSEQSSLLKIERDVEREHKGGLGDATSDTYEDTCRPVDGFGNGRVRAKLLSARDDQFLLP